MRKRTYLHRQAKRTGALRHMGQYRTGRNKTTMLCNVSLFRLPVNAYQREQMSAVIHTCPKLMLKVKVSKLVLTILIINNLVK